MLLSVQANIYPTFQTRTMTADLLAINSGTNVSWMVFCGLAAKQGSSLSSAPMQGHYVTPCVLETAKQIISGLWLSTL